MDKAFFEAQMRFAKSQDNQYSIGYQHGLRVSCYGENYQVQGGVEKWLGLEDERGAGFRDGYEGKPHKDAPKNLGRRNAAKAKTATSRVSIRITPEEKAAWESVAPPGKLSEWIRGQINEKLEKRSAKA